MSGTIDIQAPTKRILLVASNPAVSEQTGWPIGFWWADLQPFWIEDEALKIENTNFIVNSSFKPFAVRDGNLITGQQQYSAAAAARPVIEALGI